MLTKTVDVQEAQTRLTELLTLVLSGTEVIFMEGSTPIARLVPVAESATPRTACPEHSRRAGLHVGAIWTSDDFDQPLPEEFWTGTPPA